MNFGFSFKIRWTIVGLVITTQHIITIILCTIVMLHNQSKRPQIGLLPIALNVLGVVKGILEM